MKLSVNLHETLKRYNEASTENPEQELILKEANQILENTAKKDLDILGKIGMGANLSIASEIKAKQDKYSRFAEIYDISAIRKLAINYRLRFLPSNLYMGTIDPTLPSKINKFIEDNSIVIDKRNKEQGFFILAPAQSFKLQERPKDPIMFYKIDEQKFAFVHKWGNDLSASRLCKMFLLRTGIELFLLLLCVILGIFGAYYYLAEPNEFLLFLIPVFLGYCLIFTDVVSGTDCFSVENWNSGLL